MDAAAPATLNETPDLSVIVPCYNEEGNVEALTDRLLTLFAQRGLRGEVVLVNDASSDQTGFLIDRLAQTHPEVQAVHHAVNQGMEAGWRSGVDHATGRYACFIDADLQYVPEDTWRLYQEITTTHCDMVQGFRSQIERKRDFRYYASVALNGLLNRLFGMRLRDNKSGFVMARRETLRDTLRHRYAYFYFQTFIAVSAHAKGYSIREVETLFQDRVAGASFINRIPTLVILKVLYDLIKGVVEFRLRRTDHEHLDDFLQHHPPRRNDPPYRGWRKRWLDLFFLTMPLHKWMITRRAKRFFFNLKRSQWLSPDDVRALQMHKLRHLLQHAYYHVPFYRRRFDNAGLLPDAIETLADLRRLPLLTKQDVRDNLYFDLFAGNHRKSEMLRIATSGSTGEPFVTYADRFQLEMRWATTTRAMEWTGWRFGDRQARLWHQTLGMSWSQVVREHLDAWFMRRLFIPAYEMKDDNLPAFVKNLAKHDPVLIDGYAESFNFLAHFLKTQGNPGFHPKAVMSSAQVMPLQVREIIEQELRTKVFDKYGSREFSGIAYECDHHEGHHVMAESYIVEVLKDGAPAQPGEIGEIVITDLNNYSVPMIRYRIGDLAVAMDAPPCPCGRGLPRIGRIEGRVQAIVVCGNGTWMPGTFFAHFFKDYDYAIRHYQVVQQRAGDFTLKIVKGPQFTDARFAEILDRLREHVGGEIDVEFVTEIPLGRTGKRTGVVSHLKLEFQTLAESGDDGSAA